MRFDQTVVTTALAAAAALFLALPAAAQEQQQAEEPAQEETAQDEATQAEDTRSTGTPVTEDGTPLGQPYVAEEHGAWQLRCVTTQQEQDPCQLYQLLSDQNGASVAEITVFPLPEGSQAVAGATIITPLETLLTEQLLLQVDGGQGKQYPFTFCTQAGCFARIGLVADDLSAFRAGSEARIRIVPAAAPDQQVVLTISLSGFTAGYNALAARTQN